MIDLRCEGTMHGRLDLDDKTIEVKCKRRGCGSNPDTVVLHTFSIVTGELLRTDKFANPRIEK